MHLGRIADADPSPPQRQVQDPDRSLGVSRGRERLRDGPVRAVCRRQVRPPAVRCHPCVCVQYLTRHLDPVDSSSSSFLQPSCAALPLVNSAGTSITCTTAADRDARIAATGATAAAGTGNTGTGNTGTGNTGTDNTGTGNTGTGNANTGNGTANAGGNKGGDNAANGNAPGGADNSDPQKSTTLAQASIQPNYASDGNAK